MSKLHQLKSWYSFEETAARLSQTLGEVVTDKDVIQLAAEGKLKCGWLLNGAHFARRATAYCAYPRNPRFLIYSEPVYDANGESWGESLAGIYSLPVDWCPSWGWWILTFIGLGGEGGDMCGPLVIDEEGVTWELYDEASKGISDFFHFPKRHEVVFRREDIEAFEETIRDATSSKQTVIPLPDHNSAPATTTAMPQKRQPYTWDKHALRKLWDESLAPGASIKNLSDQYGITRQSIEKSLKKAKEEFGPKKADPFAALGTPSRKK
ncbi:hypothetical protein [Rugamonas apoptosis]|uniref:Uncharacterized protein n=1 Tax=Rugamonas apoptosis TaxID=2758570 RepID=A0A7W2F8E1_9BURK|nr:hypothetical protein [Rugamonas apoptosis]MBA5686976.1 hypothetical protein [Rugamonas apoptosis]